MPLTLDQYQRLHNPRPRRRGPRWTPGRLFAWILLMGAVCGFVLAFWPMPP